MPVPLRTTNHKAEAKYNVTTEFPSLGLHSAAATGNIGLVEYALDHGQPINSVLDGVLPLHAACAGGNEQVVKLLIEHGADVNAPRLPRRYSNDKNRDASAPIVGTSGSTPLHFAAANGNTNVVTTLLLHGAHPNRPDKHGITPEMLARQHGWLECAEVLRTWVLNKDRDLRERPAPVDSNIPANRSGRERLGSFGSVGEASVSGSSTRRRLQVKQSIDTALNMLKPSSTGLSDAYLKPPQPSSSGNFPSSSTPPASPGKPFGEYTFIPTSPSDDGRHSPNSSPIDPDTRRPSLPHILAPPVRDRKTSIPAITGGSPRRPRSAGTGAEEIQEQESASTPWGKNSTGRRLASKYSLLNLFKKAQAGEPEGPSAGHKPSQSIATASSSPALGSTSNLPLSSSPKFFTLGHNNHSTPVSHDNTGQSANIPSSTSGSPFSRAGFRFHRGSDASTRARPPSQQPLSSTPPQPTISLAVDLHNAIAQQQQQHRQQVRYRSRSGSRSRVDSNGLGPDDNIVTSSSFSNGSPLAGLGYIASRRDRSGSGASIAGSTNMPNRSGAVFDDDVLVAPSTSGESAKAGARPSILRAHTRSSSIGQNVGAPLGFRALRFDSTSSGSSGEKRVRDGDGSPANGGAALRSSNSAGSLVKFKLRNGTDAGRRPESAGSSGVAKASEDLDHVYETAHGPEESEHADEGQVLGDDDDDDGEDDYGRPIYRPESTPADIPATDAKVRGPLLLSERGLSLNSSHSSLSPILSNDGATVTSATVNADFPFSINRPPMLLDDQETPLSQSPELLRVPSPLDNRGRGDSISSTSTTDSRGNPSLSVSGTTSGSGGSMTVTTPLLSPGQDSQFGPSADSSPRSKDEEFLDASSDLEQAQIDRYVDGVRISPTSGLGSGERRVRAPLDINISSISSHAQAEALVQRAQQDILEMAHVMEVSPLVDGTAGRTPLSAKLAAYGESLALERRLREQEAAAREAKTDEMRPRSGTPISTHEGLGSGVDQRRERVERQHSLGNKTTTSRSRTKEPRRPSTAEGLSPRLANTSFSSDQSSRSHYSSHSVAFVPSHSSRLSINQQLSPSEDHSYHPRSHTTNTHYPDEPSTAQKRAAPRAHTPAVDPDHGYLSRISSLDKADADTELGPALFRVSTAPLDGATPPPRGKRDVRSANKLTRMGFSPSEQARAQTPSNKRFGAIKSLMQSLKGKP